MKKSYIYPQVDITEVCNASMICGTSPIPTPIEPDEFGAPARKLYV